MRNNTINLANIVKMNCHSLTNASSDYDPLIERSADAKFVLLGEASHGTHEFYRARAKITKRLIKEKGFNLVAVEADWPDSYRVNMYVRRQSDDADAREAQSHYFYARLADQFDALLHFDKTSAVEPLERNPEWTMAEAGEAAETFPFGV